MEPVFLDRLLYEREFSLLFEWGHRWIDARRFDEVRDALARSPRWLDPSIAA